MVSLRARASMSTMRRAASGQLTDVRPWPHDSTIAHLVLLDVASIPTVEQIVELTEQTFADDASRRAIRTSALFPGPRERFAEAGYEICERLALLERPIDRIEPVPDPRRATATPGLRLRRLGQRRLDEAERIDRASFPDGWTNTAATLADIALATPRHRARVATVGTETVGFAITGLAGNVGYVQRLAVDPEHQRRGIARVLLDDALGWLQRRGATTVLVNTGTDNEPALDLYRAFGFRRRRDDLVVMERER